MSLYTIKTIKPSIGLGATFYEVSGPGVAGVQFSQERAAGAERVKLEAVYAAGAASVVKKRATKKRRRS